VGVGVKIYPDSFVLWGLELKSTLNPHSPTFLQVLAIFIEIRKTLF